jgi:uncharacterized lipoprotein YmbA
MRRRWIWGLLCLAAAFTLSFGCSRSPSTRFYTLSPAAQQLGAAKAGRLADAVIGVGPVRMADYLDQAQMVTRRGDHQVVKDEFNRWAGPLRNNLLHVLADNIGALTGSPQVYTFPWRQAVPITFQVTVEVVRLDGYLGDRAELEARWSIFQGQDKKLLKTARSQIVEAAAGPEYSDLVAAQSRAVARLSQEIVQALGAAAGRP